MNHYEMQRDLKAMIAAVVLGLIVVLGLTAFSIYRDGKSTEEARYGEVPKQKQETSQSKKGRQSK